MKSTSRKKIARSQGFRSKSAKVIAARRRKGRKVLSFQ